MTDDTAGHGTPPAGPERAARPAFRREPAPSAAWLEQTEQQIRKVGLLQTALLGAGTLPEKLQRITDGVVDIFGADFARIWLTRPGDLCEAGCMHTRAADSRNACRDHATCLHLVASSGRYTHLDGAVHARVPLGCYKIGRIASGEEASFLTNDVVSDPRVHDPEWARRAGLVAFAGYRLRPSHGETIGVLALFSKSPIPPDQHALLTSFSSLVVPMIQALEVEAALKESEALLGEVGDIARIGGWEMDLVAGKARWTRVTYDLVGLHPGDPVPGPDDHFGYYVEEDRARVAEAVRALIEENVPLDLEARAEISGRGLRWLRVLGQAVREQGRCVRVRGTLQDITERKNAEAALRASEERFRSLIEAAPEAVFVQSGGLFVYVNEAMVKLVGAERAEDLLGRHSFDRVAPEFHDLIRERIRHQRESRVPAPPMEQEYLRLDGSRVPVEATAVALRFQGRDAHVVFVRDVTARRKADADHHKLQDQLQQAMKMEAVGRLAGGIAHDFNNLLTGITGNVSLALLDLRDADPLAQTLQEIGRAAESAATLTRQLLAFSRKQLIEPKVVDLNELIATLQKMLARLIGEDIELKTIAGEPLGAVRIDPGQFEQIIVNLAVNSRDAMPDGGRLIIETANVELDEGYRCRHPHSTPGPHVMLAVSDTGHGMSKEVQAHVFEPFFTTKETGKGTGLGLAMVYGVVKQSGGFIDIYSEEGLGTTCRIYLPRVAGRAERLETDSAAAGMPSGDETVLLVEDEALVRDLAIRVLKRLGYRVLHADSGGDALVLAERHQDPIHLLLTDVVLPGMNGRELAQRLAALHPETTVLFTSGYTEEVVSHRGVVDQGLNFIGKPYAPNALARKIREVLDRR